MGIKIVGVKIWSSNTDYENITTLQYVDNLNNFYLHRTDGPAVEWNDGTIEWWIDNKHHNGKEMKNWLKENNVDLTTQEGQMAFKLRWS